MNNPRNGGGEQLVKENHRISTVIGRRTVDRVRLVAYSLQRTGTLAKLGPPESTQSVNDEPKVEVFIGVVAEVGKMLRIGTDRKQNLDKFHGHNRVGAGIQQRAVITEDVHRELADHTHHLHDGKFVQLSGQLHIAVEGFPSVGDLVRIVGCGGGGSEENFTGVIDDLTEILPQGPVVEAQEPRLHGERLRELLGKVLSLEESREHHGCNLGLTVRVVFGQHITGRIFTVLG